MFFILNSVTLEDGMGLTFALRSAVSSPLSDGVMLVSRAIHALCSEVNIHSLALAPGRSEEKPSHT